jgi:tetratricopeptide (TPR) repeat protein
MKPITLLVTLGCAVALASARIHGAQEPFFDGLGTYTRTITTTSPEAQKYFNQGLNFYFGFNHGAAIWAFKAAATLDPDCAMAHWGIALAPGPHINFPLVPPPAAALAWKELSLAQEHAAHASTVEQALIEALTARYANPQPDDRGPLDQAYAYAMRAVWKAHPEDPDVGALFAEAMMDLRPWDQWTRDGGPQPGTDEIVATLDQVLKLNLYHPFANHLYVHALEASPHPERALAAADRMRDLQPGIAHNVHMPAIATPMLEGEILVREGKLDEGLSQLRAAINAEDALRYDEPPGWILPVRHSLGANLMQAGRYGEAEQVYRDDLARLPENGWSLYGLARSLELQHKNDEAAAVETRFHKIWAQADMQITSSCLCQPGS